MFAAYAAGTVERACVPVVTSIVGATPYMDAVLDLPDVTVIAEYSRMLGYSLLAPPGTRQHEITEVFAHPVAFVEARPWLDRFMPYVRRTETVSGGAAAQRIADSPMLDKTSVGPRIGTSIYGLVSLVDGIEEGPHNVTRWWVLGRETPAPSGRDKTSLLAAVADADLAGLLALFGDAGVQVLTIYERPSRKSLDTHRYLIEVAGHASEGGLMRLLNRCRDMGVVGSYPRAHTDACRGHAQKAGRPTERLLHQTSALAASGQFAPKHEPASRDWRCGRSLYPAPCSPDPMPEPVIGRSPIP